MYYVIVRDCESERILQNLRCSTLAQANRIALAFYQPNVTVNVIKGAK